MKNVLLLFGGNSPEHEVSCLSAKSILLNIDHDLFDITAAGISKDNKWYIFDDDYENLSSNWLENKRLIPITNIIDYISSFDIVFPIIHGVGGEDGKLQGFLELFNIKYVGSDRKSSANGMDKATTKIIFGSVDIPQIPYFVIDKKTDLSKLYFNYPVIVKPANGGSSIGITIANNFEELKESLDTAFIYDHKLIIEDFIESLELECAVLEKDNEVIASTVGQIIPCNKFYDYEAKYLKKSQIIIPANISDSVNYYIQELAIKAFKAIEAKDLARVDFLYSTKNNQVYLNEINTLTGFTNISMYPKLFIYDGINYKDLLTILINNNLKNTKNS
jgi:D-alanine-D-alanine ligase